MPSLSIRLPDGLIEQAQSIQRALPPDDLSQIKRHHSHAVASKAWREVDEIEGVKVKVWRGKEHKREWSVLVEVALRLGLKAIAKGEALPASERGGEVFNLTLHEIELTQILSIPTPQGEVTRGRKAGKGAAAVGCIMLGLKLLAERYEVNL